jgi:hypothetical protein
MVANSIKYEYFYYIIKLDVMIGLQGPGEGD